MTESLEEAASLDEELLAADEELLLLDDGPPSGEVPLGASLDGSEDGFEDGLVIEVVLLGGRVTSQPGRAVVVVVVVVEVDVGGVVVVDVGVAHGGRDGVVVPGDDGEVDGFVGVDGFEVGGFGGFVLGVGLGAWLPSEGGPDANASVSGSTGSAAIGLTPRA